MGGTFQIRAASLTMQMQSGHDPGLLAQQLANFSNEGVLMKGAIYPTSLADYVIHEERDISCAGISSKIFTTKQIDGFTARHSRSI